jgi:site-specific recombinase XerD
MPPKHATAEEVKALLDQAKHTTLWERNYAAIHLLAYSGLRVGGLITLQLVNVNLEERFVLVREKGRGGENKARIVPIAPATAAAIAGYLDTRPHTTHAELLISRGGTSWSASAVRRMMRYASKNAGLQRNITPHMLRHYFGFESVRRGMPLKALQQILGHKHTTTTEIYTQFDPQELRAAYDAVYTTGRAAKKDGAEQQH